MNGLPDILADSLDVVFCGLNPGLQAAAVGHHFAGRGNRFWQVLFMAASLPDCSTRLTTGGSLPRVAD